MRNIFIPLELNHSKLEEKLIETAISHSQQLGSKCWLIHLTKHKAESSVQYLKDCKLSELTEEHRKLQQVVDLFDEHKIDNEGILFQVDSIDFIQVEINKLNIDCLFVGNNSDTVWNQLFNSSKLRDQIEQLKVPTLIIPK